jgi:hypothetical protein
MRPDGGLAPSEREGKGREGQGTRREVALADFETRGTWLEGLVESGKVPSGWEGDGGMRLAGLDARRLAPGLFDN